jgi:hypothetical protein
MKKRRNIDLSEFDPRFIQWVDHENKHAGKKKVARVFTSRK